MQQATRQRDIKAPNGNPSTVGIHHLFLATFVTIALFAIYVLTNTPSASITNVEINPPDNFSESNIAVTRIAAESNLSKSELSKNVPQTVASINLKPISLHAVSEPSISNSTVSDAAIELPAVEMLGQSNQSSANQTGEANSSQIQLTAYLQSQPWIITKVRGGDSLSRIFKRNGLNTKHAYQIARLQEAESLLKIQPGQNIKIKKDRQGEFALLQYQLNMLDTLTVRPLGDQFAVEGNKTRSGSSNQQCESHH